MRSVFLERILSEQVALSGLDAEFPDQIEFSTKVVFDPVGGNAIGWLYIGEPDDPNEQRRGPCLIQADYSGRHWDFDAKHLVVEALRRVQTRIGGEIQDYGD